MILLEKEFTLDDIEIGDMVRLRYGKNLPHWVNKQSNEGHWFFVLSKIPLIVCISSTNTDKINNHFPWNIKYYDRREVAVKTDTPIRIELRDIKEVMDDVPKNPLEISQVLNRYNNYILYRKRKGDKRYAR